MTTAGDLSVGKEAVITGLLTATGGLASPAGTITAQKVETSGSVVAGTGGVISSKDGDTPVSLMRS